MSRGGTQPAPSGLCRPASVPIMRLPADEAGVAQSVEQHIRNVRVVGSNPITGSKKSGTYAKARCFFCVCGALTPNESRQSAPIHSCGAMVSRPLKLPRKMGRPPNFVFRRSRRAIDTMTGRTT